MIDVYIEERERERELLMKNCICHPANICCHYYKYIACHNTIISLNLLYDTMQLILLVDVFGQEEA